jgi:hypothetical protein
MSYHTLYIALKVIFGTIIGLWLLFEALQWWTMHRLPKWLKRDLKELYVDADPKPDARSSQQQFAQMFKREER